MRAPLLLCMALSLLAEDGRLLIEPAFLVRSDSPEPLSITITTEYRQWPAVSVELWTKDTSGNWVRFAKMKEGPTVPGTFDRVRTFAWTGSVIASRAGTIPLQARARDASGAALPAAEEVVHVSAALEVGGNQDAFLEADQRLDDSSGQFQFSLDAFHLEASRYLFERAPEKSGPWKKLWDSDHDNPSDEPYRRIRFLENSPDRNSRDWFYRLRTFDSKGKLILTYGPVFVPQLTSGLDLCLAPGPTLTWVKCKTQTHDTTWKYEP